MVSASHAKGAAEIAARGISVTKEIAYATVLGLAGGAVFKARGDCTDLRCGLPRGSALPAACRRTHASASGWLWSAAACGGRALQRCAPRRVATLDVCARAALTARAAPLQVWHWNGRRKTEQFYADVAKAQAAAAK